MNYPCLKIDLEKISHNSKIISARCAQLGVLVVGVTKCVLGDIKIAAAMKKSGVNIFGDSRLENLRKLRNFYGKGLGTNARCITKNGPAPESLKMLKDLWEEVMKVTGRSMPIISGGNSSVWNLIEKGKIPEGINQVRIGEAILLGHDTVNYKPIKGAFADSFLLEAEIIEVKRKDGKVYKVILALGLQDVDSKNIYCCSPGLYIIGQSSDHTILGIKEDKFRKSRDDYLNLEAGGIISFNLDYFGLLSCMTSSFIKKSYIEG